MTDTLTPEDFPLTTRGSGVYSPRTGRTVFIATTPALAADLAERLNRDEDARRRHGVGGPAVVHVGTVVTEPMGYNPAAAYRPLAGLRDYDLIDLLRHEPNTQIVVHGPTREDHLPTPTITATELADLADFDENSTDYLTP